MTGVYAILNLVTERRYVGSSRNIPQRWREHLSALGLGNHANSALQADWLKYGSAAFSWYVLQECATRKEAIQFEQFHIDSTPDLYNAARRAGSGPRDGFRHTEESKRKMSSALKGRPKPEGFGAKVAGWRTGQSTPKPSLRGRKHSPEHCEAIRISHLGKTHTAETKAKMSAAHKGRDTSAWAWKMAATKRGKPWSAKRREMFIASKLASHNGISK